MDGYKIIVWNCRGAGNDRFRTNFKDLIRQHSPEIVALLEPKVNFQSMGSFFHNLGFTRNSYADPNGRSGGIWVTWDPTKVSVFTIDIKPQVIHVKIRKNGYEDWILSALYASPNPRIRDILWEDLQDFASTNTYAWSVAGDFNEVAKVEETRSSSTDTGHSQRRKFVENINACKLMDMGASGPKFTWTNGRQGSANVQKRLDRGLCNEDWRAMFPEGMIQNLPRTYSDHAPLLISPHGMHSITFIHRPFRFEAAWIMDATFGDVVLSGWNGSNLREKIDNFSKAAISWNKNVFGNIFRKKRWTLARIKGVQDSQSKSFSHNLISLEKDLVADYNNILAQEELLWFQKSRAKWIVMGERNTRYFHLSTIIRRRKPKLRLSRIIIIFGLRIRKLLKS